MAAKVAMLVVAVSVGVVRGLGGWAVAVTAVPKAVQPAVWGMAAPMADPGEAPRAVVAAWAMDSQEAAMAGAMVRVGAAWVVAAAPEPQLARRT